MPDNEMYNVQVTDLALKTNDVFSWSFESVMGKWGFFFYPLPVNNPL